MVKYSKIESILLNFQNKLKKINYYYHNASPSGI